MEIQYKTKEKDIIVTGISNRQFLICQNTRQRIGNILHIWILSMAIISRVFSRIHIESDRLSFDHIKDEHWTCRIEIELDFAEIPYIRNSMFLKVADLPIYRGRIYVRDEKEPVVRIIWNTLSSFGHCSGRRDGLKMGEANELSQTRQYFKVTRKIVQCKNIIVSIG